MSLAALPPPLLRCVCCLGLLRKPSSAASPTFLIFKISASSQQVAVDAQAVGRVANLLS